ncbi:DUF4465 domain-containing protein [Alistipes sp.]|uniref:DUF4465 domain-containing protein n=1 Tax=Alistipes sp. TaxID=1872444 RepID=UPI0025BB1490|nr:DUF4465 domain-containing protein [Alistipes sp.]
MKQNFSFLAMTVAAMATVTLSACNADDDFCMEPLDSDFPQTRAEVGSDWVTVTFDDVPANHLAGPTSYGANLYDGYTGSQPDRFTSYTDNAPRFFEIVYGLNKDGYGGTYNYWNGGIAVSNWNIRSNVDNHSDDWWYSFQNQCSVYNTASADNTNANAGHSGSNFGVVYGYTDTYSGFIACAQMALANSEERRFDQMYVCNSSYAYGVIVQGNSFTQGSLSSKNGWFKLVVRGYKAGAASPVAEDEIYLADYRNGRNVCLTEWTLFNLTNIRKQPVNRIEFDFEGSDAEAYGLNTPAYVCIDDVRISKN